MTVAEIVACCRNLRLLYVEDNKDARTFTMEMLQRFFTDIEVAVNGEEGFKAYTKGTFDLIITDINMPKMDGIALIKKIKAVDTATPIIVLSAYNDSGYFEEVDELGVVGYLNKPMALDHFSEVMAHLCQTHYLPKAP